MGTRLIYDATTDSTHEEEVEDSTLFDTPAEAYEKLLAEAKERRAAAFAQESDPLFFQYQRGEIEQALWLDKVAEIRARYPDPEAVDA